MNRFMTALLALFMGTSASLFSGWSGMGRMHYGTEVIDVLDIVGAVSLDGTQVTKRAKVVGSLQGRDATIEQLQVVGGTQLEKSIIFKPSSFIGAVSLEDCQVKSLMSICSENISLSGSVVESIHVLPVNEHYSETQVLRLSNGSVIKGSVFFEAGHGKVILDETSRIEGKVEGNLP